jgi:hypothetical protein
LKPKIVCCLLALPALFGGCGKVATQPERKVDACALLTGEEIQAVQGSRITESKKTERAEGGFRISQCYFGAQETSKSVSLVVTQSDPDKPVKRTPKDYWQDTFARHGVAKQRERPSEESERESAAPAKIEGVGDDAYWIGNRVGGVLYAIKKKTFIRLSLGGPDDPTTKIDKSKTLAKKALDRL